MRFHDIHANFRDEDQNFLYVWFILYAIRVWGTIRCLMYLATDASPGKWYMKTLLCLQAVGDPLQAFCNSVLFCVFDKTVRRKIFCVYKGTLYDMREQLVEEEIDVVS